MTGLTPAVLAFKTLTLLLGALVTLLAWRAYRATGSPALRSLAAGFALVTAGSLLAGALDQVLAVAPAQALLAESALTALGFAVVVHSLYVD